MGYSLYPLRCTDFWYCYHDDNRPEGTCFTKQHRKIVCYFAGIVTGIALPLVRQRLGGWSTTVIVLSLLSCVMMIPICLFARERVIEKERVQNDGAEESYTLRDMVECLRKNKYLLLFFAAPLISSLLNVGANWGLYVARYCLGGEEAASYVSMAVIIPTLIGAVMAVELCKNMINLKSSIFHIFSRYFWEL